MNPNNALKLIIKEESEKTGKLDLSRHELSIIPEEISQLDWLTELNLNYNQIRDGSILTSLPNLKSLILSENLFRDIIFLKSLTNLQSLNLASNPVSDISILEEFDGLEELNLHNIEASDFYSLKHLENLKILRLQLIKAKDYTFFEGLKNLIALDLHDSNIRDFNFLQDLQTLQILNLQFNGLTDIEFLRNINSLIKLELKGNEISNLDPLKKLINLVELDLSSNHIKDISALKDLRNLEVFRISGKQVTDRQLGDFQLRYEFDTDFNEIANINPLKNLTKLRKLDLDTNLISNIDVLKNLTGLQELNLNENQVKDLRALTSLKQLQSINLNYNHVIDVSPINELISLKKVSLLSNQIKDIRSIYDLLNRNIEIELGNNPIENPPDSIVKEGIQAVIEYFDGLKKEEVEKGEVVLKRNFWIKLVFTGNSRVGKTMLRDYLVSGFAESKGSTHWLEIKKWIPQRNKYAKHIKSIGENQDLNINIFDFGGQEYFHDTHRLFFSDNTGYILLFERERNKIGKSLESFVIKNISENKLVDFFHHYYWLEAIKYYSKSYNLVSISTAKKQSNDNDTTEIESNNTSSSIKKRKPSSPVLLIQNKIDIGEEFIDLKELKENYSQLYAYQAISIKNKLRLDGLEDLLFEMLGNMAIVGSEIRESWIKLIDLIENVKTFKVFTIAAFMKYCNKLLDSALSDQDEARFFAIHLNSIGMCLFFHRDEVLKNSVFVGLNDFMNKITNFLWDIERDKKGYFNGNDIKTVFGVRNKPAVLKLLESRNVIIQVDESKDLYIAPLYLPQHPPKALSLILDGFEKSLIRYNYKAYYHKSIVLQIFSAIKKHIVEVENDKYVYWKHGVVISSNHESIKEMVLINFSPSDDEKSGYIDIRPLKGRVRTDFIKSIEKIIDDINIDWTVTKEISIDGKNYFSIEDLKQKWSDGNYQFRKNNALVKLSNFSDFKDDIGMTNIPKKIFVSYSHKNRIHLEYFIKHLAALRRQGIVEAWDDRQIVPGEKWDESIKDNLLDSDIVFALFSAHFIDSDYIWKKEMEWIKMSNKEIMLIPIMVEECDFDGLEIGAIQMIKYKKEIPIGSHNNLDEAWSDVIRQIKNLI